jgi:hypothetical protein
MPSRIPSSPPRLGNLRATLGRPRTSPTSSARGARSPTTPQPQPGKSRTRAPGHQIPDQGKRSAGPREGEGEIQAGGIPGRAPQIAVPVVAAAVLDLAQHILARDAGGRAAGVSCHAGYVNNQGDVVSLAMLGHEHTELGTELILTWGEPNGGARKPQVEQHEQSQIRVTVAPAPCNGRWLGTWPRGLGHLTGPDGLAGGPVPIQARAA